eukprot:scaffold2940_cov128-Isochrysis_galbana.AAC.1
MPLASRRMSAAKVPTASTTSPEVESMPQSTRVAVLRRPFVSIPLSVLSYASSINQSISLNHVNLVIC